MLHTRGPMVAVGAGAALMVFAVVIGNSIQTDVSQLGVDAFAARDGFAGWLVFFLFAFGFPLGLGLAAAGAASAGGTTTRRLLVLLALAAGAATTPVLVPLIFGRQSSPLFFSTGGYIILALAVASMWLWARRRRRLERDARLAADLQGGGYACFGMAAWNMCGIGGMPSFALQPQRMIDLGTSAFAAGQMKAVMVLLVLGWLLTFLGYRKSI